MRGQRYDMNNIKAIANMLTDDPDVVISEERLQRIKKKDSFVQYMQEGNIFKPIGQTTLHKTLPPAVYDVKFSNMGPIFEVTEPRTDELIYFEDSRMSTVLEEVDKFWSLKPNFSKLGYMHNRGILLFGPPGTGKTCLIHQINESMINNDDIVLKATNVYELKDILGKFREIEPDRRAVVVLEDMDEYIGHQERDMLQLLDGSNSTDNILFIGTTNYINRFPKRLLRPGRFDKKIHIDYPPINGRKAYLEKKLNEIETDDMISELAEKTKGFSFGHLRELVIAGYAFQEDLGKTISRLRDMDVDHLPIRENEDHKLGIRSS